MSTTTYIVRPGNTLYGIAQFFGTTIEELQRLNGINNPDAIYVGQILKIPDYDLSAPNYYIVRPGDSLWSIANRYGITVQDILAKNNLANPNILYPGQILALP